MIRFWVYAMIYLGSALMAGNLIRYSRFIWRIQKKGQWEKERLILHIPQILMVLFLLGYLLVGMFGRPDLIISGILFFGAVFVALVVELLCRVTNRIQENEHLEAKLMAVEESSRAKTGFLSSMSHEIRTPMNAIIGLDALALKEPNLPPQTRDYLEKIGASAGHLLYLINDILDMSRIESGRLERRDEVFSMKELLSQVNGMIQGQCDQKGLSYTVKIEGKMKEYYKADQGKLKQVLLNILGNAVKYTPVPGHIVLTIQAGEKEGEIYPFTFLIEDDGIGMEESFLEKIFDPFVREDESNKTPYGGTGLGLSITKNLMELMDGEVTVKSKKEEGSTFVVKVPFYEAAEDLSIDKPDAEEASLPEQRVVPLKGLKALMAEDMVINAEILKDLLGREEILVDWAENGKKALTMFEESEEGYYDVILMDMRMPEMDGISATRAIRALPRKDAKVIPILALTANAYESDAKECLEAGMNAHLAKPIKPELIFSTMQRLVTERREKM